MEDETVQRTPTFVCLVERPDHNTDMLKIPMKFRRMHLHKDKATRATLRLEELPNMSWKVGVRRDAGQIFLKVGWEKFLEDNMEGTMIGLMFTYEGNMTFSVARYENLGSRMLGLPKNVIRKRNVRAGCSNVHTTFLRYVTDRHNTNKMRVPDGATAYFTSHKRRYVHLQVDHRPSASWAVRLRVSQSGNVWFARGWDRFVEDNELSDGGKFCLFHCGGGTTLRMSLFDIYDGTVFRGEYSDVDSPYTENDGDDLNDDGEDSEDNNLIVATDEGERVDLATWDDARHPYCICKIRTYSVQLITSFVRDNLDCNMRGFMNVINPQGEGLEVNVVPSSGTLKLSAGFGNFREINELRDGSWCKFVLLGPKTLVVSPVPKLRRRRRQRMMLGQ